MLPNAFFGEVAVAITARHICSVVSVIFRPMGDNELTVTTFHDLTVVVVITKVPKFVNLQSSCFSVTLVCQSLDFFFIFVYQLQVTD